MNNKGRRNVQLNRTFFRRHCIAELYRRGYRVQRQIVEELEKQYNVKVHESVVSRDLKFLREAWQEAAAEDYQAAVAEVLAELEGLKRDYYEGWEASRQDKESTLVETVSGEGGKSKEKSRIKRDGQAGDSRFLDGVGWCIKQKIEVRGLKAPSKMDIRKLDIDLSNMSAAQLVALSSGEDMVNVLSMETDNEVVDGEAKLLTD